MNKEERALRIKILMDASNQFSKGLDVLEKYADKFGRDGFIHSVQELIQGGTASLRGSIDALTHFLVEEDETEGMLVDREVAVDPANPLFMTRATMEGWTLPTERQRLRTFGRALPFNMPQDAPLFQPDLVLEEREQLTDPDEAERF